MLEQLLGRVRLRLSALLCGRKKRVVHTSINGYQLLVFANEDVGRLIHYGRSYEPMESKYLISTIQPDWVCLDIGANVGYFTMLMARAATGGVVHAFEPIPVNASLLRASVELNGYSNVIINETAVADYTGALSFSQSSDMAYSSILDTGRKPVERTIKVPVVTLDQYLERGKIERVDLIKVDVEGAEELVLKGSSQLLGRADRKPKLLLLELFDQNLSPFGSSARAVMGRMKDFGYSPFVINSRGVMIPFNEGLSSDYYNVFFLP